MQGIVYYINPPSSFSPSFEGGVFFYIYINGGEAMKAIFSTYKLVRKHAGAAYIFILVVKEYYSKCNICLDN